MRFEKICCLHTDVHAAAPQFTAGPIPDTPFTPCLTLSAPQFAHHTHIRPVTPPSTASPPPIHCIQTLLSDRLHHTHTPIRRISNTIQEACQFINKARISGRRILVHCFAGINRSATLCIAYLMVTMRRMLLDTVQRVYNARTVILSNRGFMAELVLLAHSEGLLDDMRVEH